MYENLKGKKLLVIGSTPIDTTIIKEAQSLGLYVISVDGITDYNIAVGKKMADEAWDIDYSDTDLVAKKCKENKVDGVFAGYSEFRVLAASRIAKKLGLPFYATEDQILMTRNKRIFKELATEYGINVPKDYYINDSLSVDNLENINFPVIVKPADYGGRKGISVCDTVNELDNAINHAIKLSQSNEIIIEEYITGTEFAAMYTIADGDIRLSCLNEKYITNDQDTVTGLCSFVISPAFFLDEFILECDTSIKNFLKGIKADNGAVNFQGIYTKNKFYIFEMGYRINGNNDFIVSEKINDVSSMKMLINYSITGSMGEGIEKENPYFKGYTVSLPINIHGGKIGKFDYSKLLENKNIYDINSYIEEGDIIPEDGSTNQKAMLMRIEANTYEKIKEVYNYIMDNLIINDINGNSMIFKTFDLNLVFVLD